MKSAIGLAFSAGLEAALPLLRLIILARFLPQGEFGAAVTVLATLGIVEMCTDVGLSTSAVRGSATRPLNTFMSALHLVSVMRGASMALIALAVLTVQRITLDTTFDVEIVLIACLAMAVRSFENLHMKQLTRSYNFGREAMLSGGAQILWTIVMTASLMMRPSAAALFHGQLAYSAWIVLYSNFISRERWSAALDRPSIIEAMYFGAPLVPNGLASAVSAMDRVIVGNLLGTRAVAMYNVAIGLAVLPRAVLYRLAASALVPHFANIAQQPEKERAFYRLWLVGLSVLAAGYALALILLGPFVIRITFGPAYVPNEVMITLIAVNAFIKIMMVVPVPASFARGETKIVFLGSMVTAIATMPAALALMLGLRDLETFVLVLNVFEGLGLVWFLLHTSRRHGLRRAVALGAIGAPLLMLGSMTAVAWARL